MKRASEMTVEEKLRVYGDYVRAKCGQDVLYADYECYWFPKWKSYGIFRKGYVRSYLERQLQTDFELDGDIRWAVSKTKEEAFEKWVQVKQQEDYDKEDDLFSKSIEEMQLFLEVIGQ